MKINFHEIKPRRQYKYVIIVTKYKDKWVFCRQKNKDTWEIPGGHVEQNEQVDDAARRELCEETGALKFDIKAICDITVTQGRQGEEDYSRLYYAKVYEFGELGDFEIEEIIFTSSQPEKLSYPIIQPVLFEKVKSETELFLDI